MNLRIIEPTLSLVEGLLNQSNDMSILEKITKYKREFEVPRAMERIPLEEMKAVAMAASPALDLVSALRNDMGVSLIAEIKKASPSKGVFCEQFNPLEMAALYSQNGAAAISILTDQPYFQGHLDHLKQVKQNFPNIPLLRKDFIIHPYQVYEARAYGADAILLITAILTSDEIRLLRSLSKALGMSALVENHNRDELEKALDTQPDLVGINNRDLKDFSVNIETCLNLHEMIPADTCCVAESGIHTADDVHRLAAVGMDAMLVGEALITAEDQTEKIKELVHAGKS